MNHKSTTYWAWMAILALGLLIFAPHNAMALSPDEVEGKSDEVLASENWETREVKASSGTVKCGLLAILISTVWRGYGHYCIDDASSHYKLLGMEGTALGLMATSFLVGGLSKDDNALSGIWKSLFHYGMTLFVASYLFDVIGTFKGDTFNFSDNHLDPYGHSVAMQLRWIPSNDFNLGLQLAYSYRHPRFWISPYGYVDVTSLSNYDFGVDWGVALWYAERKHTYVAIAMDTKYEDYPDDDYKILKFLPYIEFSLDLGTWFDHLAELRFVNRLGIGASLYDFGFADTARFSDHDTLLVLESEISLNVIDDFNIAFTYRYRSDYVVGQLSAPSRIFDTIPVPGVGVFSLDLNFRIARGWYATIDSNFGRSVDFWLGAAKHF